MTARIIRVNGIAFSSLKEAAQAYEVPRQTFYNRLKRGWTPDQAAGIENSPHGSKAYRKGISVHGTSFKSVSDAAKAYGLNYGTVLSRLKRGEPVEAAFQPVTKKNAGVSHTYTISDMRRLAEKRGGQCLSSEYTNARTRLRWRCEQGHEWEAVPDSVRRGAWCRKCYFQRPAISPERAKLEHAKLSRLAEKRGGTLVSAEFTGVTKFHRWRCRFGHKWKARPTDIKFGTWCPSCAKGLGERICRLFFEKAFLAPFPTKRPAWLISPRGGRMELDGYNKSLAIAFEHQGSYHYKKVKIHHRKQHPLSTRQDYDQRKRVLCANRDVLLVEIPEIPALTKPGEIKSIVCTALSQAGRPIPESLVELNFDSAGAYTSTNFDFCLSLAEQNGGKCLAPGFIEWNDPMEWQCAKGHTWQATPGQLKHAKTWCPECANRKRLTIGHAQKLAAVRGGKCLSRDYGGAHGRLTWQCEVGHKWRAPYSAIQQGTWCPQCVVRPAFPELIQRYKDIAKGHGGECLSVTYKNAKTKLRFRCQVGHEWEALPDNVFRGSWCHKCANKRRTGRPPKLIT